MAGFQDLYPSLPGHLVQFKDGNLNIKEDPSPSPTESVLFIGTATDGPELQPLRVTPQVANAVFGKMTHPNGVPNGTTLLPAFEEAWNAGCRDIRLMRVSGKKASLSLAGASYTSSTQEVNEDVLGAAPGNAEVVFTLPHGGVDVSSVVVQADGIDLAVGGQYTIDAGVASDLSQAVDPEVKATLTILADATDMGADITVSYDYNYLDVSGVAQVGTVVDNNTDSSGSAMIADGADKVYNLTQIPRAGLKLYADGAEILDATVFTVDSAAKTVTLHSTTLVKRSQLLEASYEYDIVDVVTPTVELESVFGGSVYNDTKAKVEIAAGVATVTITKPDSKKALMSEPPLIFRSTDYPSFLLFVNAVNGHADNNVVRAKTSFQNTLTSTLQAKVETFFAGGSDEINLSKEELYKRLGGERDSEGYIIKQGAYQLLENYKVDTVIPLGVYADDKLIGKYDDFAYQLALACAVMSHYNNVTVGYIGTSSPVNTDLKSVNDHVDKLVARPNNYYMRDRFGNEIKDGDGHRIDLGQFIAVVAGPDVIVNNSRVGLVATNSPATLGGFISALPVQSAPTNKVLPTVLGARFEYSAAQLDKLIKARYVTYKVKNNGASVAVVDAMTAAHVGSDYARVATARIVKSAVNEVRDASDPFLGEPIDTANRNALTAAISKRLDRMKEGKALTSYDFQIIITPQMELVGEAMIELTLQAPRELRKITTVVSLTV